MGPIFVRRPSAQCLNYDQALVLINLLLEHVRPFQADPLIIMNDDFLEATLMN